MPVGNFATNIFALHSKPIFIETLFSVNLMHPFSDRNSSSKTPTI